MVPTTIRSLFTFPRQDHDATAFCFPRLNIAYDRTNRSYSRKVWTCRRPRSNDKSQKPSRGRSSKREALDNAMKIYNQYFEPLLQKELEAEQDQLRLLQSAKASGLILHNLRVKRMRRLFSDIIYSLESGTILPRSRFGKGDLIDISYKTEIVEAVVFSREPKRLLVTVPVSSEAENCMSTFVAMKTRVNAESGVNTLSYERALAAIEVLTCGKSSPSGIARLIVLSFTDEQAQLPMTMVNPLWGYIPLQRREQSSTETLWAKQAREKASTFREERANQLLNQLKPTLNQSQIRAVKVALRQKLTLIQGPPGTGKTFTIAHLISCAHRLGHGQVLACAGTNVATDNLMRKIVAVCPKARVVRFGRISAMEEDIWDRSLDSILERNRRVRRARQEAERGANVNLRSIEKEVANEILKQADIIVGTCVSCGRDEIKGFEFSMIIIDEATQVTEPDSLIPFSCSGNFESQFVLVGDHFQLPPTVLSTKPDFKNPGLEVSLFLRLWACGIHVQLLDTQYRMHPDISRFPSLHFYSDMLRDGVSSVDRPAPVMLCKRASFLFERSRSLFCNVDSGSEEKVSNSLHGEKQYTGTSFLNKAEALAVVKIVSLMTQEIEAEKERHLDPAKIVDIGIISPYEGQVRLLQDLLMVNENSGVRISTVDAFQGQEKDVIIVSTVRSNRNGNTGFLKDWRRLNVSITRARALLIVVGDKTTLCHDPHWQAWIESHPKTDILELMHR